jgi:hypothetical protein
MANWPLLGSIAGSALAGSGTPRHSATMFCRPLQLWRPHSCRHSLVVFCYPPAGPRAKKAANANEPAITNVVPPCGRTNQLCIPTRWDHQRELCSRSVPRMSSVPSWQKQTAAPKAPPLSTDCSRLSVRRQHRGVVLGRRLRRDCRLRRLGLLLIPLDGLRLAH